MFKIRRSPVSEVVEDLEEVRGVSVDRWETKRDHHDDRDFIDLTFEGAASGTMLDTLHEEGFLVSALKSGGDNRIVVQAHRG